MPSVDVPNVGTVDFPDSMSEEDIKSTIKRKFYIEPALKEGLKLTNEAINQVYKIITNPAAGEASSMARHQSLARQQQLAQFEGKTPSQILAETKFKGATAIGQAEASGESILGISPEDIPSGADTTSPGITIPLSAAGKAAAGVAQMATSVKGIGEIAAAATPAAPAIYAKWAYDMIKGGVESAKDAGEAVANLIRDHINRQMAPQLGEKPPPVDQKQVQRLADDAVNTALSFIGAGAVSAGGIHKVPSLIKSLERTAEVAPATAAALVDQARAEKGPNAIQRQATEILQPVRAQPEQGAREVPAQGPSPEAGARSEPVIPQKTQDVIDFERFQELKKQVKGKSLNEALPVAKEMEEIKSRYGGLAPPDPEVITHAAYTDEEGNVHVGANHPEILEKLGVEGFDTRESRNTDQFGYRTNLRPFITREEAGPVSTKVGQNLEAFDPGEKVHSDQIRSPVETDKALGDAPAQQPALAANEGMGAAKLGELPETGIGGDIYGIAQRVREDRAKAGQVDPVELGKGVTVQEAIDYGRRINAADPAAPERFLKQFESDPDKNFSKAMIASTRAHGEYLAQLQRVAESQFGTDSPEYDAARNALSEWDRRTKPIQTEWGASGQAQQAWTDLDTGSVGGLERERIRLTEKEFTPEEKAQAGKLSKEVTTATTDTDKAAKAVNEELQKNTSPEQKQAADEKVEADAVKTANEAADKVAETEAKEREAKDKTSAERKVAQIQLDAARKAEIAARKTVERARKQADQSRRVVQQRAQLNDQAEAARRAMDAVYKTLREAAADRAEAENKWRVAQTVRDRQTADVQRKAAWKAEQAAQKVHRQAAAREAELERKLLGDAAIPVWEKARQYLKAYDSDGREVPSGIRFDDLRNKIAADLGMPVSKVTSLLARSKRMKFLTDDLWLKQARERNAKTKAKLWVQGLDMPAYEKFLGALPRVTFAIRVGFHGTVALGTHAPAVAFDPRFWGPYIRNFGNMYKMVASRTFYEGHMQDLLRRKNYATARRGGLVNDPYKYEGFERQGITSEMAGKISDAMSNSLGLPLEYFTKAGERGYSILKVLRQDMFDQHWDNLPRQMQTTEMAEAISDLVNHITGVVKTPSPLGAELIAFAPKLQLSRAAFLAGDPLRAAKTGVRVGVRAAGEALGISRSKLPSITPAEKYFAVNEVKSKAIIVGTLGSLLALNQGVLMMSGSKQTVNLTDPFKNDFAKFKVAGLNLSYGNPLITMPRLGLRIATAAVGPGGKLRKMIYPDESAAKMAWEYFRSQLSPFASLAADNVFREDWQGRQLPQSERPEPKRLLAQGIEPYTPGEYWTQQLLPIPFQEFVRETWKTGYGISPEQMKTELKALGSTAFMAATGGRISADTAVEHAQ